MSLAHGWSAPTVFSESRDSLGGSVLLIKQAETFLALQGVRSFVLSDDKQSSTSASLINAPGDYIWAAPTLDTAKRRVFFQQCYTENDCMVLRVLIGELTKNGTMADASERRWVIDQKELFGNSPETVHLNDPGKRGWPNVGSGVMRGNELYVPFCLGAERIQGKTIYNDEGPFYNGILYSTNTGTSWYPKQISNFEAFYPSMCETKGFSYFFGTRMITGKGFALWFSRKSAGGDSWAAPKTIANAFANAYGRYVVVAETEEVHVCWTDRRHEKHRLDPVDPECRNYEIAYCQCADSDGAWSKDVIISKGLKYSYTPTMSTEATKIVIAWAGIETASDGHAQYDPNDIFNCDETGLF